MSVTQVLIESPQPSPALLAFCEYNKAYDSAMGGFPETRMEAEASARTTFEDIQSGHQIIKYYVWSDDDLSEYRDEEPAQVRGTALFLASMKDNPDRAYIALTALPEDAEHLEELWQRLQADLDHYGRTVATTWTLAHLGDDFEIPHVGRAGHIPVTRFLESVGFTAIQGERVSLLEVAEAPTEYVEPAGYEIVSWTGPVPERYRPSFIDALTEFDADIPRGDDSYTPVVYTEEKLARQEKQLTESGWLLLTTVALKEGQVAGMTQVMSRKGHRLIHQEDTIVLREHRGHGLGLAMKKANIANVRENSPHGTTFITWNADENKHMRAINEKLGFKLHSMEASWLKS